MKSDASIFGARILGNVLIVIGVVFGLGIMFSGAPGIGILFLIIFAVVGKYLLFKSNRRHGHVIYHGGSI